MVSPKVKRRANFMIAFTEHTKSYKQNSYNSILNIHHYSFFLNTKNSRVNFFSTISCTQNGLEYYHLTTFLCHMVSEIQIHAAKIWRTVDSFFGTIKWYNELLWKLDSTLHWETTNFRKNCLKWKMYSGSVYKISFEMDDYIIYDEIWNYQRIWKRTNLE